MNRVRKTPRSENDPLEAPGPVPPKAGELSDADRHGWHASNISRWIAAWERFVIRPDLDFEETRRRGLFTILILPGIFILYSFAIYHLSHETFVEGIFDLGAGLWLLLAMAAFRMMKSGLNIYRLNAAILAWLFLFLSVKGGVQGSKLMWSFSFPLIALYTLGKREGLISSAILYCLTIVMLYMPLEFVHSICLCSRI